MTPRGVVTFQLFVDPSRSPILGIEINPRFGGGYPLSHAAGSSYPAMLINEYLLDVSPSFNDQWQPNVVMLRYDTMVTNSQSDISSLP